MTDLRSCFFSFDGEIGQGVDVIAGRAGGVERVQGVVHLLGALDAYASHFDHPGWKALETGH